MMNDLFFFLILPSGAKLFHRSILLVGDLENLVHEHISKMFTGR